MKKQINFWREFKWKWFYIVFFSLFLFTLILEILFDANNWQHYFETNQLLRRFVLAVIIAFITRVFQEKQEMKKRNQKTT